MTSGRQRVGRQGALPDIVVTHKLCIDQSTKRAVLTLCFQFCGLESLDKILQGVS